MISELGTTIHSSHFAPQANNPTAHRPSKSYRGNHYQTQIRPQVEAGNHGKFVNPYPTARASF